MPICCCFDYFFSSFFISHFCGLGDSGDLWRSSGASQDRKGRTLLTKALRQTAGSQSMSEKSSPAHPISLALHAVSTDFFDESSSAADPSASDKERKEGSTAYTSESSRGTSPTDKNANLKSRNSGLNTRRDLGPLPESGSNVVDGILRIRGTFYAKEYVTVITKKRILQDLCYDDNFDVLCTKFCIICHSLNLCWIELNLI